MILMVARRPSNRPSWWDQLSKEAKQGLLADPYGAVPEAILREVARTGDTTVGEFWTRSQAGPDGYFMSRQIQDWLHDAKLHLADAQEPQSREGGVS